MKITVIVTTYNNPYGLKKVLDGFSFQTKLPDELIVADDGSGTDTEEVIRDFSLRASFPVIHVWQEDKGFRLSKIRNKAIKKAQGDYIVMLDGDCIPSRHFVKDHLRLAQKGFFVQAKRILVNERASKDFTYKEASSVLSLTRLMMGGSISNKHHVLRIPLLPPIKNSKLKGIKGCNMGFFRDDLIAINGFNEAFKQWGREDSELAVRLFRYGIKRKGHPFMAVCFHLWHPTHPRDSLTISDAILEETIKSKDYFCEDGIIKRASPQV